ncbi:MAG: ABC transporter ATP-binding protein [Patescibacteria group bacterium]|mgnify:CR=1 FL=1
MSAIEIKNLKKFYGRTKAVSDISLSIAKGEIFGFLGPNGAGKTTTIRCLLDFIRPTSGSIKIDGKDSRLESVAVRQRIGYLSGDVRLYENWTGQDHIGLMQKIRGRSGVANDLIRRLDFNPKAKTKNLSSGNRQKLGLILALMHEPDVLILDEPTVGLDPLLQNTIYEILREFKQKGRTVFMSSHYLREVELVCDRVGIIRNGLLVASEIISNLKKMRLYHVSVFFSEPTKVNFGEAAQVIRSSGTTAELHVQGDINPLIEKISRYKLRDLEIERASLEDIFMEYYEKE